MNKTEAKDFVVAKRVISSKFDKFDENKDGVITRKEAADVQKIIDIDNRDRKEDQLRRMAWVAMISMLVFTVVLFMPFISDDRVTVLSSVIQTFYVAQAGVIATFYGASAYIKKWRYNSNNIYNEDNEIGPANPGTGL